MYYLRSPCNTWKFKISLIVLGFFIEIKFTLLKCTISVVFCIFLKLCNHHHYPIPKHSITPKRNSVFISSHSPFSPPFRPWQLLIYFLSLSIYLFWTFNIIKQHVTLCVFFHLAQGFSKFIHVVACINT